jgi:hypothetical protein
MAAVVITRYHSFKKKNESIFLFHYHLKIDTILYPLLILAIIGSLFFVTAKFGFSLVEVSTISYL